MKRDVTIVGAGLVGSLLAVLLRQRGFAVTLYEKRADIRHASSSDERSINLVITSRGLNGLNQAGLLNEALSLSVPIFGRMIHTKTGAVAFQSYGQETECNFSISRSALNKFLLSAAEKSGVKIFFRHSLENLDCEKRSLIFTCDGESVSRDYDLLFGADGAGSQVRRALCQAFPHAFQAHTDWLDADYKELFIPADPHGRYKIEKNALHIWPRGSHMMMALANLDGSFTVTVYMPKTNASEGQNKFSASSSGGAEANFAAMTSKEKIETFFREEFKDAVPLMNSFSQDFLDHPQGRLGTVRCSKWVYEDSIALIGDAAHAIVPFFGQGMNCGFEDCVYFLKILDEHSGDWRQVLRRFEEVQKPNADAIAEMAVENWLEMRDKVGDARFLLRKKVEALLEKEFPNLFKSRYGMVTYTLIPYFLARQAGRMQDRLLEQLCADVQSVEEISLSRAKKLLNGELAAFIAANGLQLETAPLVAQARRRFED